MNYVPGGKVYTENNIDRFGLPIRPMKPLNIVPGPDHYQVEKEFFAEDAKGGTVPMDLKPRGIPTTKELNVPGPAFYNSNKEPKKISFLFNPAEKWVK